MELKDYQQRVIDNLGEYLAALATNPHLGQSFKAYWNNKGVTGMEAYKNNAWSPTCVRQSAYGRR